MAVMIFAGGLAMGAALGLAVFALGALRPPLSHATAPRLSRL
jgi:hypothetical protein